MEVENLCDFYASDYHLSIILMEFLNKINMEKTKIITIFENGIEDEINKVKEDFISHLNVYGMTLKNSNC